MSTWSAFVRTEQNWKRLRDSESFDYDMKSMCLTQDGKPPPFQFVTSDGAIGNPNSWEKLRLQSGNVDHDIIGEEKPADMIQYI